MTYQTYLYKGIINDFEIGWEAAEILFQSKIYDNPAAAMYELSLHKPIHTNFFCTMVEYDDADKVIGEKIFDPSIIGLE
jgi:hypothetical protein